MSGSSQAEKFERGENCDCAFELKFYIRLTLFKINKKIFCEINELEFELKNYKKEDKSNRLPHVWSIWQNQRLYINCRFLARFFWFKSQKRLKIISPFSQNRFLKEPFRDAGWPNSKLCDCAYLLKLTI